MEDKEIINALECCRDFGDCSLCPYDGAVFDDEPDCAEKLHTDALALINLQKAEIERLREKQAEDEKLLNDRVVESVNAVSQAHLKYENALEEQIKTVKAEAIKEFADRLKKKMYIPKPYGTTNVVDEYVIDTVVKEICGELSDC